MEYNCKFKDEVFDAIEWIENEIQPIKLSSSMYDTFSICKFFSLAIHQQIKGAYTNIESRNLIAFRIINRSLVEYIVDQRLISIRKDTQTNKLFSNYHKLKLFWELDEIDFYQKEKKSITNQYNEYVIDNFSKEFDLEPNNNDNLKILNKKIKNKYYKSWIGLTFPQKLYTIITESIIGFGENNTLSIWGKSELELKNKSEEEWKNSGSFSKISKIANHIFENCNKPILNSIDELEDYWKVLQKIFKADSNSTHPTSYSVFPHLNPTGLFEYEENYNFADELFIEAEEFLFIAFNLSFNSVISGLPQSQKNEILDKFTKYSRKYNKLSNHFKTKYGKNANSTGDK